MNDTDQFKMLLSMFATQLPTLLVCFVAGVVILGKWKEGSSGSKWALMGFGLTLILCFAIPIGQTAVRTWAIRSGVAMAERTSVLAGLGFLWSVLRAVTYALLLAAVFAGRSISPSKSTSL